MKKEILIVSYRANIVSGAEKAIVEMIRKLDKLFQFTMLVPGEGILAEYYRSFDLVVWIKPISTPRRKYPGLHYFQSKKLSRELQERNITLVICNTFSAASRISTASRMAGIPYAIYVREYVNNTHLHQKVLKKADILLTVSKDLQTHLQQIVQKKKVYLAYDVIDKDPIEERILTYKTRGRRHSPFDDSYPLVGWAGRITAYKQPQIFVQAIPYVLKEIPSARFVLIGSASEKEKYLETVLHNLALELGVSDKVAFMGQREDVIELMIEMAVFCLTSTREPLGRVILEAQIVGCPVIGPASGGSSELVQDYSTGIKVDTISEKAPILLGEKITELLLNQTLAQRVRESAYVEVKRTLASLRPVKVLEEILMDVT
jgi:glycosyltransferase involved in cell wall biosynthesis